MKTPSNGKVARGKVAKRSNGNGNGHGPQRSPRGKLQLPVLTQPKASGTFDCAQCGLCCTYLAIEIDGPTSVKRATELLWYLYHQDVSLYLNDDDWMIQFETTC